MEIPGFIEDSMVTRFYNAGAEFKVDNVLISRGIAQENACEVVAIEFAPASPSAFHALQEPKVLTA